MQLKTESLQDFFLRTLDYFQLRGLITDNANGLEKEFELDSFISFTIHGEFLHQEMVHDRNVPAKQHEFTPDQIVGTLNKYLQTNQISPKLYTPYNKRYTGPYNKSINGITNKEYPIKVDMEILNTAINVLQKNPSKLDQDCMICLTTNPDDADHKFNNCGILNNIEHLCSVYIQSCITARCVLKAQEAAYQSNKMKAINSIASCPNQRCHLIFPCRLPRTLLSVRF